MFSTVGYIVAGAATIDAFAVGVWIGKKWGNSVTSATVGSAVANDIVHIKALIASLEAKVAPVVDAVKTDVAKAEVAVTPIVAQVEATDAELQAKIKAAVTAATAK